MTTLKSIGQAVGLLLLIQLVTGLILPYVLLSPVSAPAGAFLETAAGMADTVRLSVLVLVIGGAAALGIAIVAWPVLREHQQRLGLLLLALAVINFTLQLNENSHWLSLLSTSEAYEASKGANPQMFEALGFEAQVSFRWAHYTHIMLAVAWLFVFHLLIFRGSLAPRWMPALGMVAALLHFAGIILPAFGGLQPPFGGLLGAPLGLASLILSSWLMARGFAETSQTLTEAAPSRTG
jgi:hypothetical protein